MLFYSEGRLSTEVAGVVLPSDEVSSFFAGLQGAFVVDYKIRLEGIYKAGSTHSVELQLCLCIRRRKTPMTVFEE